MGIIYHIFCTVTGKAYVGQTWGSLERHWSDNGVRVKASRDRGGRAFVCLENNITYQTQHEAARSLGLAQGNIRHVLRGEYNTTGGYHFVYLKEDK